MVTAPSQPGTVEFTGCPLSTASAKIYLQDEPNGVIVSQSPEHGCSEAQRVSQQERQAGRRQVSSLYTASFWHRCVGLSTRADLPSPSVLPADRDLQSHNWGDRLTPLCLPLWTLRQPSCSDTPGLLSPETASPPWAVWPSSWGHCRHTPAWKHHSDNFPTKRRGAGPRGAATRQVKHRGGHAQSHGLVPGYDGWFYRAAPTSPTALLG